MKKFSDSLKGVFNSVKDITISAFDNCKEIKDRRSLERKFHEFSPKVGKVAKTITNFGDTAINAVDATFLGVPRLLDREEHFFEIGEHLYVQRRFYTHHAIYIGSEKVIHYLQENVRVASLREFADGAKIFKMTEKQSPRFHRKRDIVKRAYSRLGENSYNVVINNCDSFARWCRNGL